jgi:hypothetical protein
MPTRQRAEDPSARSCAAVIVFALRSIAGAGQPM